MTTLQHKIDVELDNENPEDQLQKQNSYMLCIGIERMVSYLIM